MMQCYCQIIRSSDQRDNENMHCILYVFRDPQHSPGGELVLGGTDPNYYTGNFNYMETREMGKWEVTMKG